MTVLVCNKVISGFVMETGCAIRLEIGKGFDEKMDTGVNFDFVSFDWGQEKRTSLPQRS